MSLRRVLCCVHLNWVRALGISNLWLRVRGISRGIWGFREQFDVGCNQFREFVLCSVSCLTSPQILNMTVNPEVKAEDVTLELKWFLGHTQIHTLPTSLSSVTLVTIDVLLIASLNIHPSVYLSVYVPTYLFIFSCPTQNFQTKV